MRRRDLLKLGGMPITDAALAPSVARVQTIAVWDGAFKNYALNYGNDYGGRSMAAWLQR